MKNHFCYIIILCSFCVAIADIEISGKVVNRNNNSIANATVRLANQKSTQSTTDNDGNFLISFKNSVAKSNKFANKTQEFLIKNNKLKLRFLPKSNSHDIEIYSITGKRVFSSHIKSPNSNKLVLTLPPISSGFYILVLKSDNITYQSDFTYFDDNQYVSTSKTNFESITSLAKKQEFIDTIITFKNGFDTSRTPISSYNEKDIIITLDSIINKSSPLTIYFIRHAETLANASGEQGGSGPTENHDSLTELGQRQVNKLTEYLVTQNIIPDFIAVSPTIRTQKTIAPFLEEANLKAEIWAELNECCGNDPSGAPLPTERPETRWKVSATTVSDNFTFATDNDKYFWWPSTYEEGLFMIMTARDKIINNYSRSGKKIMIVGHAVNGNILLGLLRGYDMLTTEPSMPAYLINAGVSLLTEDITTGKFDLKQNIHTPPRK